MDRLFQPTRLIIVAMAALFLFSTELPAQQIGKGRLLKKWRDDIFGKSDDKASKKEEKKRRKKEAAAKSPTPAKRPIAESFFSPSRQPTPAGTGLNPSRSRDAAPAYKNFSSPSNFRSNPQIDRRAASRQSAPPNKKGSGFGLSVSEDKDKNIVVSKVQSSGNAKRAGLRKGDRIVEIGGIKAGSITEFDEIAGILGQGDQMEMTILRHGKTQKIVVQWGTAQESENFESADNAPNYFEKEPALFAENQPVQKRSFDFAPPANDSNRYGRSPNSVLEPTRHPESASSYRASRRGQEPRHIEELTQKVVAQQKTINQMQAEITRLRRALRSRR